MANKNKILLIILDGLGLGKAYKGNAISQAKTPFFDKLWKSKTTATLQASGESVGLPEGQMGTSEVNHMTIGSGRVIFQDLVKINRDVKTKKFVNNKTIIKAFEYVKNNKSTLHIKGLMSDGGVHSHQEHVYELIRAAKKHGVTKIYIHVFTDGRDTTPKSAINYVKKLESFFKEIGIGKIASISGRYYAMDRDHNWDRTDKAFEILTKKSKKKRKTAIEAIKESYEKGITDEFIIPTNIEVGPGEEGTVSSNDAVIFANFRTDRPRQLVRRFIEKGPKKVHYTTMTNYQPEFNVNVVYQNTSFKNTLGEVLGKNGVKQLRITETEKFAHLTFFLNCKREQAYELEDRIMLDSHSDIDTHDQRPEMRTADIVNQIKQDMSFNNHQVIVTNLCNLDMVGHSGKLKPTIKAAEVVDQALKDLVETSKNKDYTVIITADHGNAEEMIDETDGGPLTAHTTNPVPLILVSKKYPKLLRDNGNLSDIAPTILKILDIRKPKEMTGKSLV